ncbi:LysR family transcriptional regulator [Brevibacillus sp. B_LB10_24]|uniref:LysR family transcriptional regulator n=1 Tax=Brevibacillus sp. B_LB10_24 TaxID=3380645 RepID=UPI0038B6FD7C
MDVKDLVIFQTVANYNSVSKAAAQLNYVQSNVTNRINKLESELETMLFYRTNRGMVLTSAGEILLAYTGKILHLFKEAKDAVKDQEVPSGPLSIGATDITTAVRLPSVLSVYHQLYPDVLLSIKTGSTDELVHEVLLYNLDGAFITDSIDHPKIVQEPLIEEELVFIMASSHPRIEKLQDLKNRTILVFRPGCTYRAKLEQWLLEEGIFPVKKMEFGTIEGMLGCAKAGLGTALVSKRIAKQLEKEGSIRSFPVPDKFKNVTTVFIRRYDDPVSHALKKFLETTRKCLRESED